MPETLTADERTSTSRSPATFILAVLAVLVGMAVVVGLSSLTGTPERLEELTVVNPTPYELTLRVATEQGAQVIGLVPADSTYSILEVIDRGESWDIRFSAQGVDAGSYSFERGDAGSTFEITVPDEVGRRLDEAGVTPSME